MRRALAAAKAKLAASPEVEIVDFAPLKHGEGYDIIRELYFEDGGKAIRAQLAAGGEDALVLTEWVISPPHTQDHDATSLWALHARRNAFRREYSDHWRAAGCDVVLSPPSRDPLTRTTRPSTGGIPRYGTSSTTPASCSPLCHRRPGRRRRGCHCAARKPGGRIQPLDLRSGGDVLAPRLTCS
ncbi:hypothetical protein A0H81_00081 [Grifola frondosa]|uniref:Uncharacterized protein n=1 Tax=Grifola frondosa TaxID=5627 RepID=A0A1C7MQA6_GRIFR|nr:hypothetical protein A0H81_00081 [Grifola frondosa]